MKTGPQLTEQAHDAFMDVLDPQLPRLSADIQANWTLIFGLLANLFLIILWGSALLGNQTNQSSGIYLVRLLSCASLFVWLLLVFQTMSFGVRAIRRQRESVNQASVRTKATFGILLSLIPFVGTLIWFVITLVSVLGSLD